MSLESRVQTNNKHNVSKDGEMVTSPAPQPHTPRLFQTDKNTKERQLNIPKSSYRRSERGHSSIHNDLMDPSKYSNSAKLKNVLYKNV